MNDKAEVIDNEGLDDGITYDGPEEESEEETGEERDAANQGEEAPAEPDGEDGADGADGKITFTPEQQRLFNEEIGKKVGKMHQERERADALERELQAIRQQMQPQRPEVPPVPEPYDPDYKEKIEARERAIQEQIQWDMQERQQTELMVQHQQRQMIEQQQRQQQMVSEYASRAEKLGVKPDELQAAGQFVGSAGLSPDLVNHILSEPVGPQITVHLSRNPAMLDQIAQMTPTQAAIYIETAVKPALSGSRKRAAPPPPETIRGKGAPEEQEGPAGATYE